MHRQLLQDLLDFVRSSGPVRISLPLLAGMEGMGRITFAGNTEPNIGYSRDAAISFSYYLQHEQSV